MACDILYENETLKDNSDLKNFPFQIFIIKFTLFLNYTNVPLLTKAQFNFCLPPDLYPLLLKKEGNPKRFMLMCWFEVI